MTPISDKEQKGNPQDRWRFSDSLKDVDVEEFVDIQLHRPLAFLFLKPFQNHLSHITPLHLTIASMFAGIFAGISSFMAAQSGSIWFLIGGISMIISVVLDCSDGMLARLRGGGSHFGQMVDGFSDLVAGASFWFGMSYSLTYGREEWWIWPANIVVLFSIMIHVSIYDKYKEYFLDHANVRPVRPKEYDKTKAGWFERILTHAYETSYAGVFDLVRGNNESAIRMHASEFRRVFQNPMYLMSFLGLGTHLFLMYSVAIFSAWLPQYGSIITAILIVGLMNILAIVAIANWRRIDRSCEELSVTK